MVKVKAAVNAVNVLIVAKVAANVASVVSVATKNAPRASSTRQMPPRWLKVKTRRLCLKQALGLKTMVNAANAAHATATAATVANALVSLAKIVKTTLPTPIPRLSPSQRPQPKPRRVKTGRPHALTLSNAHNKRLPL